MKQIYNEIIARLVKAIETETPEWAFPWEMESGKYPNAVKPNADADAVFNAYYKREKIAFVEREQSQSYYSPTEDAIYLPLKKQFKSTGAYYATKAHETIHSTGDYTRCFRQTFNEYTSFRFGDTKYAKEELVAEIGACFLLSELGIDTTDAEYNAIAYLQNWLSNLNGNTNWIYKAGVLASDAVDYIMETIER